MGLGSIVNIRANLWKETWATTYGPFEHHIDKGYYEAQWIKRKNSNSYTLKFLCSGDTLDVTKAWLLQYGWKRSESSSDFLITKKMYEEVEVPARERMSLEAPCDLDLPDNENLDSNDGSSGSTPGSTSQSEDEDAVARAKPPKAPRVKLVARKAKAATVAKNTTGNVLPPQLCSQNEKCENDCVVFVFDAFYTPFSLSCMRPRYARGIVANSLSLNVASLCLTSLWGKNNSGSQRWSTRGSTPDYTWRNINYDRFESKEGCRTIGSEGCGHEEAKGRGCQG